MDKAKEQLQQCKRGPSDKDPTKNLKIQVLHQMHLSFINSK